MTRFATAALNVPTPHDTTAAHLYFPGAAVHRR